MPQKSTHRTLPKRGKDVDMTTGNITRHIILFALPLLAGNIFQQLYNMVDTWVVGRFVSNEAYAAVGSIGPIAMSYPAGWLLCSALTTVYFHRVKLTSTRLVEDN